MYSGFEVGEYALEDAEFVVGGLEGLKFGVDV
jgi:hypothetical protein